MNLDIRNHVKNNIKDLNYNDMEKSVLDAINSGEEQALPGLGVIFEIIWNKSDTALKQQFIEKIVDSFK